MGWTSLNLIESRNYQCSHTTCNNMVASNVGMYETDDTRTRIYICPHCNNPTFFISGIQMPGNTPGAAVRSLPDEIATLYDEARKCVSIGAYTASVLLNRKLLMHIAVQQQAEPGKAFAHYVNYLADKGFVPPNGKDWVTHIKSKGNEANHEIILMTRVDAEELIVFMEMLLKFIYEFPARIPPKAV